MIRKISRYKVIERDRFLIEIPVDAEIDVKRGESVKKGELLYQDSSSEIIETYYLPKALGVKADQADQYIGRVSGQLIEKGDLLAERLTNAGLVTKRVVAGVDGIISTKRIKSGYIDILSESNEKSIFSPVDGYIVEIKAGKYIEIEASSIAVDYFSAAHLEKSAHHVDTLTGEHVVSGRLVSIFRQRAGSSIDSDPLSIIGNKSTEIGKEMELLYDSEIADFAGKLVYVGNFCQPELVKELYKRQALAVIGNSMDYSEMQNLGLPVIILNGYGILSGRDNTTLEPVLEYMDRITLNNNELNQADLFIEVDVETKQLHILGLAKAEITDFLTQQNALPKSYKIDNDNFDEHGVNPDITGGFAGFEPIVKVGDTVVGIDNGNLGLVGKVDEIQELNSQSSMDKSLQDQQDRGNSQILIVKRKNGSRFLADTNTVEIVV